MAESYSVKAILSAQDKNFSSVMKSVTGYAENLKTTLTGGLGFGAMAAIGGKAISVVGMGLKGLAKESVGAGMSFESAMSSVSAVSGATGNDLTQLTNKAKEMGASTKYTATEAANAMEYMAMAGWKTQDMISGIEGIMNLAAASGSDLARTSDIVTDALTAFGKSAKDSGMFADVMAAASANANTNVEMMGETFKYVGSAAGAMGYTIQDIALATGLMANSGIKGSEAGTALRSVITRMAKPTEESSNAMKALGMSITDGNGKMKSFSTIMKDLRKGMRGMTEDQKASYAAMLGGQEAMSGVLAIANASEEDFNKLSNAINNSTDAAKEMAKVKMDNLKGDLDKAKSAVEGLGITIFTQACGSFRDFAKTGTDAINSINEKLESSNGIGEFLDRAGNAIKTAKPYWDAFAEDVSKVGKAFADAAGDIIEEVQNLTGAFGKKESVDNFSDSIGAVTGALTTFAGFLKEHDKEVAKAITLLPKLVVAYKGFKIVNAIAPGVKSFAGALISMTGKGITTLAGKLFGVAAGEKAVGTASSESSGTIVESAAAFLAIGAGIALVAAGFSLLAYSAIQIAEAGPLAAGVLLGMVVAIGALMVVAQNVGPTLTAGAVGFVAFGAAVLIAGVGIGVLALAAINLANAGPLAIACMVGMVAAIAGLAVGAAALGPALTVGAVGFIAFGAAIVLVATGALIASAALAVVAGVLPIVVQYGMQGAACIAVLGAGMIVFGAGALVAGAACVVLGAGLTVVALGMTLLGASVLVVAVGITAFGLAMVAGAAGVAVMAVALKAVNSSVKSIANNAKTAQSSLISMQASVSVVNSGLDALGNKAKSAINSLISQFSRAESSAMSSGRAVGNNFNNGVTSGMTRAVSTSRSMSNSVIAAMRLAGSASYGCGVFIGSGLANGMASQLGYVQSVAAQLASAAEAAIRAKAKIHSPSKVTDELGGYWGSGWVNGILNKVKDAKKAAQKLVNIPDLVPVPEIGMSIKGGIDELDGNYSYGQVIYVNAEVTSVMDGREVGYGTARYVQEKNESDAKVRKYITGKR